MTNDTISVREVIELTEQVRAWLIVPLAVDLILWTIFFARRKGLDATRRKRKTDCDFS